MTEREAIQKLAEAICQFATENHHILHNAVSLFEDADEIVKEMKSKDG